MATDSGYSRRAASRSGRRWRRAATALAVVAVAAAVVGTAAGREAAASFLAQFRSERIQVVTLDPRAAGTALPMLGELGDVSGLDPGSFGRSVGSVAEAERVTGMAIREPAPGTLPSSVGTEPVEVAVSEAGELRLALDEARTEAWLARRGGGPAIPDGYDDTTLVVRVPATAALLYGGPGDEQVVVGQAGLVTAAAEGPLSLERLRAFLLDLPGLPPELVRQLRAIEDWRTTLPLPLPADVVRWEDITIAGHPAVRLRGGGIGSAVLWQADGLVHGVGGLVADDAALEIAEGLLR